MTEPEGISNEDAPEPSAEELAMTVNGDVEAKPVARIGGADLASKVTYLPDTHRLLPQSPDAEKGVLCSFLLSPREVGGMCAEKQIKKEHFFIPSHADIYATLLELWDRSAQIDFIALTQVLRDRGKLDECGGAAFVTELFTFLATAANCAYYMEILEEKWTLRRIIVVCTEFAARAYDAQDEVPDTLERLERDVLAIGQSAVSSRNGYSGRELAAAGIEAIERRLSLGAQISGLSTGFADLDNKTDGMHRSELIVIASLSSMGKSALAMQIVEHQALDHGTPCAVFTLEMGRTQLAQRTIYTRARVNPTPWRDGFRASELELNRIQKAASDIAASPLYVEDASDPTIQGIRATARRLVRDKGVRIVVIDSLSALHSDTKQGCENRIREAAECTEGAKQMAKELEITVILLCHIARTRERNERPALNDLRETGKVEQDADSVWMLYEPGFDPEKPSSEPEIAIWIPKQRDGDPFVTSYLKFQKYWTRFYEPAREVEGPQTPQLPL